MKKIVPFLFVLLFALPVFASAETFNFGYAGTTSESNFIFAGSSNGTYVYEWKTLTVNGNGTVKFFGDTDSNGQADNELGSVSTPVSNTSVPSGALAFKMYSDGGEVYAVSGTTNNPAATTVIFTDSSGNEASYSGGSSDGSGGSGGSSGSDSSNCFCCSPEFQSAIGQIKDSVADNGFSLDGIKSEMGVANDKLADISGQLGGLQSSFDYLNDNMTTDSSVSEPTAPKGDSPNVPIASNPTDSIEVFEDDSTYFSDSGDAPEKAEPLPQAPEPVKCWINVGNICQEDPIEPESQLEKDNPFVADGKLTLGDELQADKYTQDGQMQEDKFVSDSEMNNTDKYSTDSELSKDSNMSADYPLSADIPLERDNQLMKSSEMSKIEIEKEDELGIEHYNQTNKLEQDSELAKGFEGQVDKFEIDNYGATEHYGNTNQMERDNFYNQTYP